MFIPSEASISCADRSRARKMKAEIIFTWNIAHFLRLGEAVAEKTRTP
jgi:hypothetical protein